MDSPLPFGGRHTWVVPLKTTHPKSPLILYNWLAKTITFDFLALNVYSQKQCKMFFVLLHSMDLFFNFKLALELLQIL
jgi:hypothetical protein